MQLVHAATRLHEGISARAAEIEGARRLPADLAGTLAEAGFFRQLVPRAVGGLEVSAAEFSRVLQTVSSADASVGWCVMIGATTGLNAAYMAPDQARAIFGPPETITGGVFAPRGKAVVDGGRYRASGRWAWASGSQNCHWLCGGCVVYDGERPRMRPDGAGPDSRMLFFPRDEVTLIDTWESVGLRGTGSGDMAVQDAEVPFERAVSLADRPVASGALYAFPVFGLLAVGVASVALGNAQAALDELRALARDKTPLFGRRTLAERGVVQSDFARATGRWQSARAYLEHAIDACWRRAETDGALDVEAKADLRLACTHAARESADVARVAYELAGGTSVYASHPLQRRFRDAHVATQHIMVAPATYELLGRVGLGLDADGTML